MAQFLHNIPKMIISSLKHFPRLFEKFHLPISPDQLGYAQVIEEDEEFQRLKQTISDEIDYNQQQINDYVGVWSPFKSLWELDKETFIKNLGVMKASDFDVNISIYSETANRVQLQESLTSVYFIVVKATQLKASILVHIEAWKDCYKDLLKKNAYENIQNLYEYTKVNAENILKVPKTIIEMQCAIKLYDQLTTDTAEKVAEFPEIKKYFDVLGK